MFPSYLKQKQQEYFQSKKRTVLFEKYQCFALKWRFRHQNKRLFDFLLLGVTQICPEKVYNISSARFKMLLQDIFLLFGLCQTLFQSDLPFADTTRIRSIVICAPALNWTFKERMAWSQNRTRDILIKSWA